MNLRQAAQQALEALDEILYWYQARDKNEMPFPADMQNREIKQSIKAITALRAALAEPEQKVWCDCGDSIEPDSGAKCGNCVAGDSAEPEREPDTDCHAQGICQRSGYSITPTPRKPLTEEEIDGLRLTTGYAAGLERFTFMARAIERAHKIGVDE